MYVNADFSRPAVVTPDRQAWIASPQPGVERVMLDRIGAEQARATSLVRYAPQSFFPAHAHPGGEEILVLSGTFSDEDGDCPAGTYLRNPPGSSHQPFSVGGACIFVKLRQMQPEDDGRVRIDTRDTSRWQRQGRREICALYAGFGETVCLQRLPPGEPLFDAALPGAELLVLAGTLQHAGRAHAERSWLRLPAGRWPDLHAGSDGLTLYLKLARLPAPADPQTS